MFPKIPFTVHSNGVLIRGDRTPGEGDTILFLHGAGTSNRRLFDSLRNAFWEEGRPSLAFDFMGHGDTGGVLQYSSLQHRFKQVCHVIEHNQMKEPLHIVAASMSGYIAVKLLEKYEVENLILFVPAAYHKDAFTVGFDQGFTDIIRKERSYFFSDAWEILPAYKGNILICYAEHDDVIPSEIIERFYSSCVSAKKRDKYLVQGSPHKVLAYLEENAEVRKKTFTRILNWMI